MQFFVTMGEMIDLERIFRDEGPRLLNWIRVRLKVDEDAEDILQDTFAGATKVLATLCSADHLISWLYVSARNAVIDAWRGGTRRLDSEYLSETSISLFDESVIPDPEEIFRRARTYEALEEAIEMLPEDQKEVFLLQTVYGYTFRETAGLLNISINTAMSRKRYALIRLREYLKDYKDAVVQKEVG